jgi:hypothetical protein
MFVGTENPVSNKNIKLYLTSFDGEGVNKIIIKIFFKLF